MRIAIICGFALTMVSCAPKSGGQCPDPAMVAPPSVGGAAEVRSLAGMLSGSDNENAITEGAQDLHRRDHTLSADRITDILIAADCEGQRSATAATYNREARTRLISKRVEAVVDKMPTGSL